MTVDAPVPTRPILRYHGGKWELGPWIISHFPAHRVYVEPFGGGGSVLIRKPRSYAEIYNDLDGEVVNLFAVARDRGEDLLRVLELTPYARAEFDLSYEHTEDPVERARRVIVRSYMGFGGNLGRPTASGKPQRTGFRMTAHTSGRNCARVWADYPEALKAIIARLRGVVIENRDAVSVIERNDTPETLVYADPPYVHSTRTGKANGSVCGYRHEMTDEQHADMAVALQRCKGPVIVSGYPSALYEDLYTPARGWRRVERPAQADGAAPRTEVLWLRNVETDLFS